jgi:hypothetical protein
MGKSREKFSGEGIGQTTGRKKFRGFERISKRKQHSEAGKFLETMEPPRADILHIGSKFPQEDKPKSTGQRDEEKLAGLEGKIETDFRDGERKYVYHWVNNYPEEFQRVLDKRKRRGGEVTEEQARAIRLSFISDVKRWGIGRNLAPEKAEILENYLNLKLPVGLPEEKLAVTVDAIKEKISVNIPTNIVAIAVGDNDNKKEKEMSFTPKQSSELVQLIGVASKLFKKWTKESEQGGKESGDEETKKRAIFDQMKGIMSTLILNDPVMKNIFSEEEIPRAVEHVIKYIEKFNFNLKK